ncbi:DEAD/DEAH box helicase [Glycomyces niveus]|uniref:DEAD/DEAH box helicase n=1 Tax=Glycomyces niveus TaxID=2820287 RepID=A0ABS3U9K3_9ACTN|nr:DEAD/DEAH box helicase [Glycomyces sp. NEAU-S30]MBO3735460.1 DEAD/DEAH box helicase [Glycomyces sp. NEAU-S30]
MAVQAALSDCDVVFCPSDPPRAGLVAFYRPDGGPLPDDLGDPGEVTLVADASGNSRVHTARLLRPGHGAEVLTHLESGTASASAWGLAARKALELIASGLLLPGLDAAGGDAWWVGPLGGPDVHYLRVLAAAMPTSAFAIPVDTEAGTGVPDPYRLLRAFLDAVADAWPRSPAARLITGHDAFAVEDPVALPEFARPAAELARGRDDGWGPALAISLEPHGRATASAGFFDRADPARLVAPEESRIADTELRRAFQQLAHRTDWKPLRDLGRSLSLSVPLESHDLADLLDGAEDDLRDLGVEIRWSDRIDRSLSASLRLESAAADTASLFALEGLLDFKWRAACADRDLTEAELDRIAAASGPVVRLDDRWVLVDESLAARLRRHLARPAPLEGLRAALTGTTTVGGTAVPVDVAGPLADLRDRLTDPDHPANRPIGQPAALQGVLRDYQLRGLNWLNSRAATGLGSCLADDMGLGKTITLIGLHLHRQSEGATSGPTLVVCPASLLANWAAEIAKFAPASSVRRFHGPGRDLDNVGKDEFVITTYATMRRDAKALAGVEWSLVCADEAQHAKNPAAETAKALRAIPSGARVALTGTPVENNLTDLWAILDWTTPGLLGTLTAFRDAYGRAAERGDPETAARLAAMLRPFMLRRLKTDPGIAPELPAKTITDHPVALTREQTALYRRVVKDTMKTIAEAAGIERRGLVLKLLTELKQICNHPAQFKKEADPAAGKSAKLELLDELLDITAAEGASSLVFTQYAQMGHLLLEHLRRKGVEAEFLYGSTPVKRREAMVERFQAGEIPVLILSLKAAGVGLNLTRASHVVHFDRWWNPAAEDQATDRAYRIGQTQAVQVHRLVCEGTLEAKIAALLETKRALAESVVGSGEAALTELTDEQLHDLVRLEEAR